LDKLTKEKMSELGFIGLTETWLCTNLDNSPLDNFQMVHSGATKSNSVGRASGGILVLVNDLLFEILEVLDTSTMWVFVKLACKSSGEEIIVGVVYLSPTKQFSTVILEETIENFAKEHGGCKILVGGDFNVRIGAEGFLDCDRILGSNLSQFRASMDQQINSKGSQLLAVFESNSFTVLNGRTISDSLGEFTFVDTKGLSVCDLVFANYNLVPHVEDFEVGDQFSSDHRQCSVKIQYSNLTHLNDCAKENQRSTFLRLKWDHKLVKEYIDQLAQIHFEQEEEDSVDTLFDKLSSSIKEAGERAGMISTDVFKKRPRYQNKKWFDKDCRSLNKLRQRNLKQCRRKGFTNSNLQKYLDSKKLYESTCLQKKSDYHEDLKSRLRDVRNSQQFWSTIKQTKPYNYQQNCIGKEQWECHYKQQMNQSEHTFECFQDARHPKLDKEITHFELNQSLRKMKGKKSPGLDGIPVEFLKCLTPEWKNILLILFNRILAEEKFPTAWHNIEIINLFKKGNRDDPANYRPIALLVVCLKIFTQIVLNRMNDMIEESNILPESQAGFRKGRGCEDHIFSLSAAIGLNISKRRRKVYAVFVDFASAFPSVNHRLLWLQLYRAGISSQCIRLLRELYTGSAFKIRLLEEHSDEIAVTNGVLQGEPTSPLLFSLFIHDIEDIFKPGIRGLCIGLQHELHILAYADDLVILGDSPQNLQEKLNLLHNYCSEKKLKVNVGKTKVLVFGRGGFKVDNVFRYGDFELEVVSSYTYLGVTFTKSGLFSKACDEMSKKSRSAIGTIWKCLASSRCDSWEARMKLFDATALATLLYGSGTWGLNHTDQLEKVQQFFLKGLLNLPRSTPGYMVRLETGRDHIELQVMKLALRLWVKILRLDNHRLPAICYQALRTRAEASSVVNKFNWASLLKSKLESLGFEEIWQSQDPFLITSKYDDILSKVAGRGYEQDFSRMQNSSFSPRYQQLKRFHGCEPYLKLPIALDKIRVLCQLRLSGTFFFRICTAGTKHVFEPPEICSLCNKEEPEDIIHFVTSCTVLEPLRCRYLFSFPRTTDEEELCRLLNFRSDLIVKNMYFFVVQALKLRSWIMEN